MVRSYVGHGRSMLVFLGSVTCVSAANVGFFKLVNVSSLTLLLRCGGMVGSISWGSMPWNSWHAPLLPALVDSLGYPVSSWPGTSEWNGPGRVHGLRSWMCQLWLTLLGQHALVFVACSGGGRARRGGLALARNRWSEATLATLLTSDTGGFDLGCPWSRVFGWLPCTVFFASCTSLSLTANQASRVAVWYRLVMGLCRAEPWLRRINRFCAPCFA